MVLRMRWFVLLSAVLALAGASCTKGGTTIDATLKDFQIALSETQVDSGKVTFDITNNGPSTHEFVVFKTDLAEDQLPVENGTVTEDSPDIEAVDEVEDIEKEASPSLEVDLDPGSYVVICNVSGHYQNGMHTSLTVS